MSKVNRPPEEPGSLPQTEPVELFPTTNIRHLISETGKLTERVDNLSRTVDKVSDAISNQGDKISALIEKQGEKISADLKERASEMRADFKEKVDEIKSDLKDLDQVAKNLQLDMSFYKGAIKVMGLIFALFLVLFGVIAKFAMDKF